MNLSKGTPNSGNQESEKPARNRIATKLEKKKKKKGSKYTFSRDLVKKRGSALNTISIKRWEESMIYILERLGEEDSNGIRL